MGRIIALQYFFYNFTWYMCIYICLLSFSESFLGSNNVIDKLQVRFQLQFLISNITIHQLLISYELWSLFILFFSSCHFLYETKQFSWINWEWYFNCNCFHISSNHDKGVGSYMKPWDFPYFIYYFPCFILGQTVSWINWEWYFNCNFFHIMQSRKMGPGRIWTVRLF